MQQYDDVATPKFHMLFHTLRRLGSLGNPKCYWNFLDESLNSVLKHTARHAHALRFEEGVLRRIEWQMRNSESVRRRLVPYCDLCSRP